MLVNVQGLLHTYDSAIYVWSVYRLISILTFHILIVKLMSKRDQRAVLTPSMQAPIGLARRFYQIALGVLADVHAETTSARWNSG